VDAEIFGFDNVQVLMVDFKMLKRKLEFSSGKKF
jgi:hypothetical protein